MKLEEITNADNKFTNNISMQYCTRFNHPTLPLTVDYILVSVISKWNLDFTSAMLHHLHTWKMTARVPIFRKHFSCNFFLLGGHIYTASDAANLY